MQRVSDDILLDMVRLRANGLTVTEVAEIHGETRQYVSTATNRVKRGDEKHVKRKLTGHYWQSYRGVV